MTILFRLLALACALWLAACAGSPPPSGSTSASAAAPDASERRGAGTAWGESVRSETRQVDFERADPAKPTDLASVYYNDALPGHPPASQVRRLPTRVALANGDIALSFTDERARRCVWHAATAAGTWRASKVRAT